MSEDSRLSALMNALAAAPAGSFAGRRIGKYELLERIGRGGMGEVWRARDTTLKRDVAVKLLLEDDEDRRKRMLVEARAAAHLRHPNVCVVYEADVIDDVPFIAMELLDGESLAALLARRRLRADEVRRIAEDVAAALAGAHAAGVVHRDVKPDNVRVLKEGGAKLVDFGLARVAKDAGEASLTKTGVVLGTPRYMSPEQAEGRATDARSDVFSFGILLYEMLSGAWPWDVSTDAGIAAAILRDAPRTPPPHADEALAAIALRCLHKNKSARYPSGAALVAALHAAPGLRRSRALKSSLVSSALALASLTCFFVLEPSRAPKRIGELSIVAASDRGVVAQAISRDGRLIASAEEEVRGVFVQALGAASRKHIPLEHVPRSLAFTTDQRALIVTTSEATLRVPLDGPVEALAPPHGVASQRADGALLVQTEDHVFVLAPDGSTRASLPAAAPALGGYEFAQWSPSGARALFVRTDERGKATIQVSDEGLSRPLFILDDPSIDLRGSGVRAAWVDDDTILYCTTIARVPGTALWVLDLRTNERRLLHELEDVDVVGLDVAVDARRVLLTRRKRQFDVHVGDLDVRARRVDRFKRLTFDRRDDRVSDWLDDDTVLFTSSRNGSWDVMAQRVDEPEARAVVATPLWETTGRRAPDGGVVYVALAPPGASEAARARADILHLPTAGPARLLASRAHDPARLWARPPPGDFNPVCIRTGCVFAFREETTRLHIEPLATFPLEAKFAVLERPDVGVSVALRADGQRVVSASNLAVIDVLDSGGAHTTVPMPSPHRATHVAAIGAEDAYVVVSQSSSAPSMLWLLEQTVDGFALAPLHAQRDWIGEVKVSPSGARVAISVRQIELDLVTALLD